jgi:hypothetical protein
MLRYEALLASVRSSSRIAGVVLVARARSSARRVRAASRRFRQLDVTLLISGCSFEVFSVGLPVVKQASAKIFRRKTSQSHAAPRERHPEE